jgi:hypothetical protein
MIFSIRAKQKQYFTFSTAQGAHLPMPPFALHCKRSVFVLGARILGGELV